MSHPHPISPGHEFACNLVELPPTKGPPRSYATEHCDACLLALEIHARMHPELKMRDVDAERTFTIAECVERAHEWRRNHDPANAPD